MAIAESVRGGHQRNQDALALVDVPTATTSLAALQNHPDEAVRFSATEAAASYAKGSIIAITDGEELCAKDPPEEAAFRLLGQEDGSPLSPSSLDADKQTLESACVRSYQETLERRNVVLENLDAACKSRNTAMLCSAIQEGELICLTERGLASARRVLDEEEKRALDLEVARTVMALEELDADHLEDSVEESVFSRQGAQLQESISNLEDSELTETRLHDAFITLEEEEWALALKETGKHDLPHTLIDDLIAEAEPLIGHRMTPSSVTESEDLIPGKVLPAEDLANMPRDGHALCLHTSLRDHEMSVSDNLFDTENIGAWEHALEVVAPLPLKLGVVAGKGKLQKMVL
jgi:hypothetical protein